MIGRYAVLAGRIRQDIAELERVVARVERAVQVRDQLIAEQDLLLDSAALNLHDFYTGLERIFTHIASSIDQIIPTGPEWRRELLRQMTVELPGLRPPVLTTELAAEVDEFLRFRHVVRHNYAFARTGAGRAPGEPAAASISRRECRLAGIRIAAGTARE